MRRAPIFAFLVALTACALTPRPYRDVRKPQVANVWVTLEHHPGFEVVPSRLGRLRGERVPQASWTLRVSADGTVERDEFRACEWKTVSLGQLSPTQLALLKDLLSQMPAPRTSGRIIEDNARDVLLITSSVSEASRIEVWNPYSRTEHPGLSDFFRLWDQFAAWFPPPRAERAACGSRE